MGILTTSGSMLDSRVKVTWIFSVHYTHWQYLALSKAWHWHLVTVSVCYLLYAGEVHKIISVYNQPTRSTQPSIPAWFLRQDAFTCVGWVGNTVILRGRWWMLSAVRWVILLLQVRMTMWSVSAVTVDWRTGSRVTVRGWSMPDGFHAAATLSCSAMQTTYAPFNRLISQTWCVIQSKSNQIKSKYTCKVHLHMSLCARVVLIYCQYFQNKNVLSCCLKQLKERFDDFGYSCKSF